jgi:hypothetical protein
MVARDYAAAAIPGSSVPRYVHLLGRRALHSDYITLLFVSERVFSKAGDLISKKRNRLAPGSADTIMCLRYWLGLPEITEEEKKRFEQSREDGKESEFLVEHYLPKDDGDDGDEGSEGEENDEENDM